MTWKEERCGSARELFDRLTADTMADQGTGDTYRGEACAAWQQTNSRFDRYYDEYQTKHIEADGRIPLPRSRRTRASIPAWDGSQVVGATAYLLERIVLGEFMIEAGRHLPDIERMNIAPAFESGLSLGALQVAQHFGAATRLVDWTASPWIAAFFACVTLPDQDGVIWSFNRSAFEAKSQEQWKRIRVPCIYDSRRGMREGPGYPYCLCFEDDTPHPRDFDFELGYGRPRNWFTLVSNSVGFSRQREQHGLFTLAGELHQDHRHSILRMNDNYDSLACRKLVVAAAAKPGVMKLLHSLGISSVSLGLPYRQPDLRPESMT
ncbi:MAG: FRG domain-containing protein [Phycisphaerales bacterium]